MNQTTGRAEAGVGRIGAVAADPGHSGEARGAVAVRDGSSAGRLPGGYGAVWGGCCAVQSQSLKHYLPFW